MKENLSIWQKLFPSFSPKKEINFNFIKRVPLKINRHNFNFMKEIPLKMNDTKKLNSNNPLRFYISKPFKNKQHKEN